MKKTNILSLIFLLTILCGFNSCVDKPFDHIDDPEYILCNGAGWYDDYYDADGLYCEQRLIFHSNGRGEERIIRYFSDYPGDFKEFKYKFYWEWHDDYFDSIYMEYDNGDYIYFDELHIYNDELSGYLGDDYVSFAPF